MQPDQLPPHVAEALTLLDSLDAMFGQGLARLSEADYQPLINLAQSHAASPLGEVLASALKAVQSNQVTTHHLVAIAAGREALWGAIYDALYAQAIEHFKLTAAPEAAEQKGPWLPALNGVRDALAHNLVEMALAGFRQIDASILEPIYPTLEALQQAPSTQRLAMFATGFINELLASAPTSQLEQPPLRRWMDLWSRALLATAAAPTTSESVAVTGTFHTLGADLRQHENALSLVVHGVLESEGQRTLVRLHTSAWRVDTIAGLEAWELLAQRSPTAVALARGLNVAEVSGQLDSTGALRIETVGELKASNLAKLSLEGAVLPRALARDRHPIQLAIPAMGDAGLPLTWERLPALHGLTEGQPTLTSLIRWNGSWSAQPLAQTKGKKVLSAAPEGKTKGDATAILRERASKLLRQ